jgi:hypothetical protein
MKAKKELEFRAKEKMEKEKEIRARADEMAGQLNEFFAFLLPQIESGYSQLSVTEQGNGVDSVPELEDTNTVVPSPDSITVTTVFGVHEEPSNLTVISAAAGPAHTPSVSEGSQAGSSETALVETMDDLDSLAESDFLVTGVEQNDDGDDADIDTDDFDAESALIDEFIDDGVLTPTNL